MQGHKETARLSRPTRQLMEVSLIFSKSQNFRPVDIETIFRQQFNSLPNDKVLDPTKLKPFAPYQI